MLREDYKTLFKDVMQEINDFKEISDTAYLLLYNLCPLQIAPAFELIDKQCIKKYQAKDSKRTFYQIFDPDPDLLSLLGSRKRAKTPIQNSKNCHNSLSGTSDELKILENSDFCPCYSHFREVQANKIFMCKHMLAVNIAKALRNFSEIELVDDKYIGKMFLDGKAGFKSYNQHKVKRIKYI